MLFGAVGGAVLGGVTHGIGVAMEGLKVGGSTALQSGETAVSSSGFWESAVATGQDVTISGTGRVTQTVATTAAEKGTFLSGVGEFMKGEAGIEIGAQAVGAGISGLGKVYQAGKQREFVGEQSALAHQRDLEKMAEANKYALQQIGARGGGGGSGGGGGGPDYTIDELIRRDREAAGQERQTVLAKVGAELGAQKELKGMDLAEVTASRERAIASAGALKSAVRTGSRSTETLADIQDRIRAGEDVEGRPNVGVEIPVDYIPPEQVV